MMGIFFLEWLLNIYAKNDYFLSFFFWLDLIATVSLIQDIDYIMNPIMGYEPMKAMKGKGTEQAAAAVSKVTSAAKATRVLRVIRIVRLIRMVKLYKNISIAKEKEEKAKKEQKMKEMMKAEKEIQMKLKKLEIMFMRFQDLLIKK